MNYAELRAKIEHHFRARLEEAKQRRYELGPYTAEQKQQTRRDIDLRSIDNLEYWQILGRVNARKELDSLCSNIGIDVPTTKEDAYRVLDEIRKVHKALGEAMLEHGETLEGYDFREPVGASETAPQLLTRVTAWCCGG